MSEWWGTKPGVEGREGPGSGQGGRGEAEGEGQEEEEEGGGQVAAGGRSSASRGHLTCGQRRGEIG